MLSKIKYLNNRQPLRAFHSFFFLFSCFLVFFKLGKKKENSSTMALNKWLFLLLNYQRKRPFEWILTTAVLASFYTLYRQWAERKVTNAFY